MNATVGDLMHDREKHKSQCTERGHDRNPKTLDKAERNRLMGRGISEIAGSIPLSNPKQDKATILENAVLYLEYMNRNVTNVSVFNAEFIECIKGGNIPEPEFPPTPVSKKSKKKIHKKCKQPKAPLKLSKSRPTIIRIRSQKHPPKDAPKTEADITVKEDPQFPAGNQTNLEVQKPPLQNAQESTSLRDITINANLVSLNDATEDEQNTERG
ncbi:uncharacterized protein LOC129593875 [Paramacrobiotus metropolitanus]|uniref:uncharacterized protein LOC129593875 n=1 Tax=Paramacrobiotus metropolitanus TaxID=2943436 RepID=UPI002445D1B5|nr:uncharacterized protein LOC129593875 [Paramacrobiotus metropolitanus]